MGLHIAGAAGVSIQPPGAADTGFCLQYAEIRDPRLFESDRQPDPGKASADDEQLEL